MVLGYVFNLWRGSPADTGGPPQPDPIPEPVMALLSLAFVLGMLIWLWAGWRRIDRQEQPASRRPT